MNILVVHQFYLRPGQPGGPRFNELAHYWREAGHDVRVIASSVSYTAGTRSKTRWPWKAVVEEGVDVLRTWTLQHSSGALWRRVGSMLGYAAFGTIAAMTKEPRPDVVIASTPTLAALAPGMFAASRWKCPLIVEVRDLWPESLVDLGVMDHDALVARAAYGFEETAYAVADCVVALTPGIRDRLVARGVVDSERVVVIPNGVDTAGLRIPDREAARRLLGWGDEFVAIYAGAHGMANALEQLIEAAELLRNDDVLIFAIGDGPEKRSLVEHTNERGILNLRFLDPVHRDDLFTMLAAADAGVVCLRDVDTFHTVYPNKMFDYMAASLPVVLAVEGVAADLISEAGAGLCVRPEHPEQLANALRRLKADSHGAVSMGRRGRETVLDRFDRRRQAKRYLEVAKALSSNGFPR